jgi:aminopeptidase N
MRSLAAFFVGILLAGSLWAEERFSIATTPGKLPKDVFPKVYVIRLEPNSESLETAGSESVEIQVLKVTDRIVLNAVDTEISRATLSNSSGSEELTPQVDSQAETVTFQTKAPLQPGHYQLVLTFQSKISEQPHGLFIQYFRSGKTSHPIQQRIVEEAQANSAFDEITYQKGQSFIRMLENYLGEETFRAGIRSYIASHKYSNTTTADLWEALEAAAGKPVKNVATSWTEQPGFPLIKVKAQCVNNQWIVRLEQSRFIIGEPDNASLHWCVPIGVTMLGESANGKSVLLDKLSDDFDFAGCDGPIKANAGDVGFFRVYYEPVLSSELRKDILRLPESDRVNLVTDTWATVESGESPASTYSDLLESLKPDDSFAVWQSTVGYDRTVGPLKIVDRLELGQPGREHYQKYVCSLLGQKLAELTWEEKANESIETRLLREMLIETLGMFGDQSVIDEASRRFAKFRENPASLNPNLRPAVIRIVGRYSSSATYDTLIKLATESPTSEERRMYLHALGAVLDPDLALRSVEFLMSKNVSPGDAMRILDEQANQGEHPEIVWKYATTHLREIRQRFGLLAWNRLVPIIAGGFADDEHADELLRFAKENLPAQGQQEADNAANRIRFRAQLKMRELPKIDEWIATKASQLSAYANRVGNRSN